MVSEVALMKCIAGWTQLYNWTGIPLFFLLSMTGVKAEATEVVFYASDGFSSSLTIERALHPTALLALQANGTALSPSDGYPYRLVVPCKYGYKWVRRITEIEVVDYDYKGTYESMGYSDEADIPDCTFPSTTPSFETLHIVLGPTTYSVTTLSNSTINSFDFNTFGRQILFNVTGPPSTTGYFYVTIPKELLWCDHPEQWQVLVNNTLIEDRKVIEIANHTHIYFTYSHSTNEVQIIGTNVIVPTPERTLTIHSAPTGVTFTVSGSYHTTPWSETYVEGSLVSLVMSRTYDGYVWSHWLEDGDTNSTKIITMDTNMILTGVFTFLADLNGDGVVDIDDVIIPALAFGSYPGHPKWNALADLTGDELVDIDDVMIPALAFGENI